MPPSFLHIALFLMVVNVLALLIASAFGVVSEIAFVGSLIAAMIFGRNRT